MKTYYEHKDLKINNGFLVDLKNVLSYIEFTKTRPLTGLEEMELRECLDSLRKDGFENVVKALGF